MNSLFIFRLDLRLKDNTALLECIKNSKNVFPCFIFEPKQISKEQNSYFSNNCAQFMIESLEELYEKSKNKLLFFHGDTYKVIEYIVDKLSINSIYINQDYTPFSIERDSKIEDICNKNKIKFHSFEDLLLNPIESIKKGDGGPYSTFTSYLNKSLELDVRPPNQEKATIKYPKISKSLKYQIHQKDLKKFYTPNPNINVNGGRKNAVKILKEINLQKNYDKLRGLCAYKSTHLSGHMKFGTVSVREVYHTFVKELGKSSGLVKQLYWRDFYYNLIYQFPDTFTKKVGLKKIYDSFPWSKDKEKFKKWCDGETGFPIVDSSMKNLNETGYMPNRSRLIVANFLTKILRIDWTWGEKYFAQQLVDYSVSNNLGNWQWVASIGADYQNRIYNPMSQSAKSDPDCEYIKKWLPILKDVPNKDVHNWPTKFSKYSIEYPEPTVNYPEEYKKSKELFKKQV